MLTGTTLSILGFEATKGWDSILAANIAENFFGAIQSKKLEISIGDAIDITAETVKALFSNDDIRASLEDQRGEPERFDNSKEYLRAFNDTSEVVIEQTQNFHLGACELRILLGERLPKKVAFLRNGMLITDQLNGLLRFGEFKEFVAVLECKSSKGNALLRAMEPPRHDDFEPERLLTAKEKKQGKLALTELSRWVREMLKRHAQDPVSEVTNIDELADFFGDDDMSGSGKENEEVNPEGNIIIRARPVSPSKRSKPTVVDTTPEDIPGETPIPGMPIFGTNQPQPAPPNIDPNSSSPMPGPAPDQPQFAGGSPNAKTPVPVDLRNVRAIPLGTAKRRLIFTPKITGTLTVEVQSSGAESNYPLQVIGANVGIINNGKIESIPVTAGLRVVLEIELDRDFDGTLRMTANAV
jgi:hypothetical protein